MSLHRVPWGWSRELWVTEPGREGGGTVRGGRQEFHLFLFPCCLSTETRLGFEEVLRRSRLVTRRVLLRETLAVY